MFHRNVCCAYVEYNGFRGCSAYHNKHHASRFDDMAMTMMMTTIKLWFLFVTAIYCSGVVVNIVAVDVDDDATKQLCCKSAVMYSTWVICVVCAVQHPC